jgi:hypothetical protein
LATVRLGPEPHPRRAHRARANGGPATSTSGLPPGSCWLPLSTWWRSGGEPQLDRGPHLYDLKAPSAAPDRTSYDTREEAAAGIRELFEHGLRRARGVLPRRARQQGAMSSRSRRRRRKLPRGRPRRQKADRRGHVRRRQRDAWATASTRPGVGADARRCLSRTAASAVGCASAEAPATAARVNAALKAQVMRLPIAQGRRRGDHR